MEVGHDTYEKSPIIPAKHRYIQIRDYHKRKPPPMKTPAASSILFLAEKVNFTLLKIVFQFPGRHELFNHVIRNRSPFHLMIRDDFLKNLDQFFLQMASQ